ncbi:type I methionyl aminopeptidase [bacterium M21]|nr:type I methionyl aminopeptidase [bacterium M21]
MTLTRNEPCWCGSGRKYKQCHMAADRTKKRPRHNVPIKTNAQTEKIRSAGHLTAQILDYVAEHIRAGITTDQINDWVHKLTLEAHAIPAPLNYRGYPKSVCTSLNNVICHGIPDSTVLKDGDIINVDVTSILNGYYGDASRMFLIGDVKPQAEKLCQIALECLELGMEQVRPGNTLGDVGHSIQHHAESNGFSVVRAFTGHGIGAEFHEAPEVMHVGRPGKGLVFEPGMVFTIEPMINAGHYDCRVLNDGWTAVTSDGSLSAQWEHTLVVTDDGYDILTK